MKTLHYTLVCHTELGLDGTWGDYDTVQPAFEAMIQRVAQRTGQLPRVTYCLTNEFITDRLDDAARFHEQGHEIGVHTHLPGSHRAGHNYSGRYAYAFDPEGRLNQDRIAAPLREIIASLGFPAPETHVSGMFSFQRSTIELLTQAGFSADCSLIPNGRAFRHRATGKFVIADNRRRTDRHPYFPDPADPWVEGSSPLLEIPVSGNIGEAYFEIDWVRSLQDEERQIALRLEEAEEVGIYQSYWHHFEFSRGHTWTRGSLAKAEEFLVNIGKMKGVAFSTISTARQGYSPGKAKPEQAS
jgi:hypothetical protein